jgi:hypothetical protein
MCTRYRAMVARTDAFRDRDLASAKAGRCPDCGVEGKGPVPLDWGGASRVGG